MNEVTRIAGRLFHFQNNWETITDDSFILNRLRGYKIPFIKTPIQYCCKKQKFPDKDIETIKTEIGKLLVKGAIEECAPSENQFISPLFLVPKSDGSLRFIFN